MNMPVGDNHQNKGWRNARRAKIDTAVLDVLRDLAVQGRITIRENPSSLRDGLVAGLLDQGLDIAFENEIEEWPQP